MGLDDEGPPLNGVGERHDRAWLEQHFVNPAKFVPNTSMPNFQFTPSELKLITDYISAIPR